MCTALAQIPASANPPQDRDYGVMLRTGIDNLDKATLNVTAHFGPITGWEGASFDFFGVPTTERINPTFKLAVDTDDQNPSLPDNRASVLADKVCVLL